LQNKHLSSKSRCDGLVKNREIPQSPGEKAILQEARLNNIFTTDLRGEKRVFIGRVPKKAAAAFEIIAVWPSNEANSGFCKTAAAMLS
jgi:hypothetical protein